MAWFRRRASAVPNLIQEWSLAAARQKQLWNLKKNEIVSTSRANNTTVKLYNKNMTNILGPLQTTDRHSIDSNTP